MPAATIDDVVQDIMSGEFFNDPYPVYANARQISPAAHLEALDGWLVTGYDEVYAVLRDHERFSSRAVSGQGPEAMPGQVILISDDPPRHTRLRGTINKAFTPKRIRDLEPRIQQLVDGMVAGFEADGTDFMEALAVPLPVTMIAELMGIPSADRADFKRWSDALMADTQTEEEAVVRNVEMQAMEDYFRAVIAERRSEPAADLITALTVAEIDGQRLETWEIVGMANLLLVAGNETTTNLLGNLLGILADRPALWRRLQDDRALVDGVIEETLRYDSPVQLLPRATNEDVELAGSTIPAGSQVFVSFGAANRDPAGFAEADEFQPERDLKGHVAFGAGIHYCLGAPLARAEARVTLNTLLDRYASVERAGEAPHQRNSLIVRGYERLPLRFA